MFHRILLIAFFTTSLLLVQAQSPNPNPFIHVDQFGYMPSAAKVAVLSNPEVGFNSNLTYSPPSQLEVRTAGSASVVFTANVEMWNNGDIHAQSGDRGWWFDFSEFTTEGVYYIYDPVNDESSAIFEIYSGVYSEVLKSAMKMYYYNRCNLQKEAPYVKPAYEDAVSFKYPLQDVNCRYIYDQDNAALERDMSGGWFDAGDNNKYVSFTHNTLHNLLSAYEENPNAFDDDVNIPESGNGIPDILDEIKWELDWLMKMTNADGTVHIKMGNSDYNTNTLSPPSLNTDPRYYGPTCSSASITIASVFSHAAKVYGQYATYASFAQELLSISENCFDHFFNLYTNNQLELDCDDGSIVAGDADLDYEEQIDAAVIAAAYLFEQTGNIAYRQFFDDNSITREPISQSFWSGYKLPLHDALLMYENIPNASQGVATAIRENAEIVSANNWSGFFGMGNEDLYRAYAPDWSYHWGSNKPKAGFGILNTQMMKYNINPNNADDYRLKASEQLHYFHGVNPLGLVQLSNMYSLGGDHCVNEIYHFWFHDGSVWDNALTSTYGPPPGYLTGGANAQYNATNLSPPTGQPQQKSYLDFNTVADASWEISEPSITYQAAYVRLLANFVDLFATPNEDILEEEISFRIFPNPTKDIIQIESSMINDFPVEILDSSGRLLSSYEKGTTRIDLSKLNLGIYFIRLGTVVRKVVRI